MAEELVLELIVLGLVEFNSIGVVVIAGGSCTEDICRAVLLLVLLLLVVAATFVDATEAGTPVTFTLLCDNKLGLLMHENFE